MLAINPGLMKDGEIEYLQEFEELLEATAEAHSVFTCLLELFSGLKT